MKAEELRLGNIVDTAVGIIQITDISPTTNKLYNPEALHPIKITDEWLKNLGLVYDGGNGWAAPNGEYFYHSLRNGFMPDCYRHTKFKGVTYIHQLQNLYFAMTGEELQVKV